MSTVEAWLELAEVVQRGFPRWWNDTRHLAPLPAPPVRLPELLPRKRPTHTFQEVVSLFGPGYLKEHASTWMQRLVLARIQSCMTAALGGHKYRCPACHAKRIMYSPCQNRCCPNCQKTKGQKWVEARMSRVLDVEHHHLVFPLPDRLRHLALVNKAKVTYGILFTAISETLRSLADERLNGARLGYSVAVQTWSRDLFWHPHGHCVVTSGGLSADGSRWVTLEGDTLFTKEALQTLFRERFLYHLRRRHRLGLLNTCSCPEWDTDEKFERQCDLLQRETWEVFAEEAYGGLEGLLKYLSRYAHCVAISDWRILAIDGDKVTIATKLGRTATMTGVELLRRFLLHIPPHRAQAIRHYGLYSGVGVRNHLDNARSLATPGVVPPAYDKNESWQDRFERLNGEHPLTCPVCRTARMVKVSEVEPFPFHRVFLEKFVCGDGHPQPPP